MMDQQTGDQRQPFYLFNLEQRIPARPAYCGRHTAAGDHVGDAIVFYCRVHDRYLDEAVQEDIARHEKEKKKQHRRTSQGVLVPLRDVAGLWETPQVSERWHYGSEIVSWFAASVMVTAGVIYTP